MVAFDQRGDKNVERAKAPRAQFFVERFDANANEWRERAILTSFSSLGCGGNSVSIFFVVGTVAITIFKIDTEVFDRLALKFLADSPVDRVSQPCSFILFAYALGFVLQK